MVRRIAVLGCLAAALLGMGALSSSAVPAGRTLLVVVEQTDAIGGLGLTTEGASALLSTRTGARVRGAGLSPDVVATLLEGARAKTTDARSSALALALGHAGIPFDFTALTPSASPPIASARVIALRAPAGVELGAYLARLRAGLGLDDRMIAVALTRRNHPADVLLGMVSVVGNGVARGFLASPTTRRAGVVSLSDIGPTILSLNMVAVPPSMEGRPFTFIADPEPLPTLEGMDRRFVHAASVRPVLMRAVVGVSTFVLGGVMLLFALGSVRRARPIRFALAFVSSLPAALLLEPLSPPAPAGSTIAWVALIAAAIAAAALAWKHALVAITAGTAIFVLIDVMAGAPLSSRSPVSYLIARGDRFYGIGNELMGVVIGAALIAVAFGTPRVRRGRPLAAAFLAVAVWLMTAPAYGAKFGAALTAVPAFGVLAVRAGGGRITARAAATITAITAAVAGLVYAADRLRASGARSHIAGPGGAGVSIGRKFLAARGLWAFSFWVVGLLVIGACGAVLWRRRADVRVALLRRPQTGSVAQAAAVAFVAALAFNDAGVIAAFFIVVMVLPAVLVELLEPAEHAVTDSQLEG